MKEMHSFCAYTYPVIVFGHLACCSLIPCAQNSGLHSEWERFMFPKCGGLPTPFLSTTDALS